MTEVSAHASTTYTAISIAAMTSFGEQSHESRIQWELATSNWEDTVGDPSGFDWGGTTTFTEIIIS